MRQLAVLSLFLLATLPPAFAARLLTVAQFEQQLLADYGKSDARFAGQLADVELTERASAARLDRWESDFPGPRSREALIELADTSSFLDLPAADIPSTAPPDREAERQMLSRMIDYASKTIRALPNFTATRETIHFEDTPSQQVSSRLGMSTYTTRMAGEQTDFRQLHVTGKSAVAVAYCDGQEVDDTATGKARNREPDFGLVTFGEFGPILSVGLADAARSHMAWGCWEQRANGLTAVFRYQVAQSQSHYLVSFNGSPDNGQTYPAYHGEIAIDVATGSVLRLTVIADTGTPFQMIEAAILVGYAPVVIGNKTYICPVRGVALSKMPVSRSTQNPPPLQSRLNDVAFTEYHLFRTDARIIPSN